MPHDPTSKVADMTCCLTFDVRSAIVIPIAQAADACVQGLS